MFRRREGHLLAAHLGRSLLATVLFFASLFFIRGVHLIPRFAACGPILWSGSTLLSSLGTCSLRPLRPITRWVPVPGQTDVPSRLRSTSPSAIVFCTSPLFCVTCSAVSRCTGAVGRVSRPRSSTSRLIPLLCISFHFHCSRVIANCVQLLLLVSFLKTFKWRGQVVRLLSSCHGCPLSQPELEWTSWLVAFVCPIHRTLVDSRTGCPS